jgi:hypothetical protein
MKAIGSTFSALRYSNWVIENSFLTAFIYYISGMVGGIKNVFLFLLPVEPGQTKSSTGIDV